MVDFLLVSQGLRCLKAWLNLLKCCFIIYWFITACCTVYTGLNKIYNDLMINYVFILFFSFHAALLIKFFLLINAYCYLKLPFSNSEIQEVFAGQTDTTT